MSRSKTRGAAIAAALLFAVQLPAQRAPAKPAAAAAKPAPRQAAMPLSAGYDPSLYSGLKYRMIGPLRGGRVTAVTGVASNPQLYYMGSTGGGIWKTTDAGHSWVNISDGQLPVGSMGAIEVVQSDPNIIYAGTGSSKIRSNVSIGKGMFKSTDAGKTWKFIGLKDAGQIATIRVNPANPNIVFVAALGDPFASNVDRGVFRSNDGGASWKKVLYVSDSSGAADLELQPGNPNVVFASIWHGLRKPWTIVSGGMEGGIYKSTDGGDNWTKLGGGLPAGLFGRSNVSIPASMPNRIYALIEAKPGGGLYRSDDAGATWALMNGSDAIHTRGFYYTTLEADPNNADVVYVGDEGWFKSTDGGKTFRPALAPHGDHHDMWINPKNSEYMIQSNDGGANVSLDGGHSWSTQDNQPTAEIYQVALDHQYPYRVYGAQQDNTTLIVPSLQLGAGQAEEWRTGPGCETGPIIPNRTNPDIVYGSCKGQFSRMNLKTGEEQQHWVGAESLYGNGGATLTYRFQRVSPMEVSPHEAATIYYGSQYVHRTRDDGVTWERISPDLTADPKGEPQEASGTPITRDATGEEMYSVIYSIRESPITPGLIWTGSNDGLFYVTRDDGKTWTNITPKDLPPGGRVQNIEPSPHRPGTAYYAYYRFLLGGDFAPYIYRTDDYGKTWTKTVDGIAGDEPVRVVREDPVRAGLLYAGTEFGMHISFDNGAHWHPFQQNLPATPVTDIKFGRNDMVLSTQGRAFWIMDNVTPLRQLSEKVASSQVTLFRPEEAVRTRSGRGGGGGVGRGGGVQYPAAGAQIDYYVSPELKDDVTLEILDGAGKAIRKFSSEAVAAARPAAEEGAAPDEEGGGGSGGRGGRGGSPRLDKKPGMHRMTWDLRYPGALTGAGTEGGNGPEAVPGQYAVRLTAGSIKETQPLTVVEDPRILRDGITLADLQEQFNHNMHVRDLVSDANKTVARLRAAQQKLKGATGAQAEELAKLNALADDLITSPIRYSEPKLLTHITYLYSMTNGADQRPGKDAIDRLKVLRTRLDEKKKALDKILGPAM
ncbi:MAG: WD40/YVTN/BNR-like repeat-containing protein [Gemmatimonadales bacterium]